MNEKNTKLNNFNLLINKFNNFFGLHNWHLKFPGVPMKYLLTIGVLQLK